jgi:2-polyprenyl-6-methoxyphenol hydroxylase-like FAD-dependent oxidoreductase
MVRTLSPDIVVIGAGPVGCVTAIAWAHSGAKVMLLEAQAQKKKRLAGEWLHPPGVQVLERLGLLMAFEPVNYATGLGFVVFTDDGSEPIPLHYPNHAMGISCEHNHIVSTLQKAAADCEGVNYIPSARVTKIQGGQLTFKDLKGGENFTISSKLIVGADGRSSAARKALGIPHKVQPVSYMAGVLLENVELPFEGFGHLFLGGPGPITAYRVSHNQVRICLDVPLDFSKKSVDLWDVYSPILPSELLEAFRQTLEKGGVLWVANQYSPRIHYGCQSLALVGDATGYFHPMTATGMTIGFMDAECLLHSNSFNKYQSQRSWGTYVPEMLATTLYEVFCHDDDSAVAIRRAVYKMWRQDPKECVRTMHLLSGAQTNLWHFISSFLKALVLAVESVIQKYGSQRQWRQLIPALGAFGKWLRWPIVIAWSRLPIINIFLNHEPRH